MKKLLCILSCLLVVLALSACSKEKAPDWTKDDEIYAATFDAVAEELATDQKKDDPFTAADFLKYDKDKKIPYFDFTEIEEKDAERVAKALKEVWDGKEIPLWGARIKEDDPGAVMFAFFKEFNCRSIKLDLPLVCDNSDDSSGLSAGSIRALTELTVDGGPIEIESMWGMSPMTPCEDLKALTCISQSDLGFSLANWFPKLESLTLLYCEGNNPTEDLANDINGTSITEVSYLGEGLKGVTCEDLATVEFYESLIALDQIKKINGEDKDKFEIPMDDSTRANYEEQKQGEEADALVEEIKDKLDGCKGIDTDKEEGKPKLGKKIIARIDDSDAGDWSILCALTGKDYECIPADRLAKNYEEADTYLYVHDYHYPVGSYTNGAMAYKTYTMVITFDLKNGNKRAAKCIAVEDPPKTITSYNNIPTLAGSGEYHFDEALAYVKKLL